MFAALLIAIAAVSPAAPPPAKAEPIPVPEASKLLWSLEGTCPSGQGITLDTYDMDPMDPEAAVKVWSTGGKPFLVWDVKAGKFYLVGLRVILTMDEMMARGYDSPCAVLGTPA